MAPKTILINASNVKVGGAVQVTESFLRQLEGFAPACNFVVVLSSRIRSLCTAIPSCRNVHYLHYDLASSLCGICIGRNSVLDKFVDKYRVDLVFTIFGPPLWKPKVPHLVGFARSQLIYRDSPFWRNLSLVSFVKYTILERIKIWNFKVCSDVLVTENADVSSRLLDLISGKPIYTVTNTCNQVFYAPDRWEDVPLEPFDGLTLLTISANYPHKNLAIIREVADYLVKHKPELQVRFVLTLTEEEFPVPEYLRRKICTIGRVSIEQCPTLYKQSDVMFLPTLLECFTASYAEAMQMGTPILTSDLSFARGLCGDSALYCDPLSVESIVESIEKLGRDRALREELASLGYESLKTFDTAQSRAKKYVDIIISMYKESDETNYTGH